MDNLQITKITDQINNLQSQIDELKLRMEKSEDKVKNVVNNSYGLYDPDLYDDYDNFQDTPPMPPEDENYSDESVKPQNTNLANDEEVISEDEAKRRKLLAFWDHLEELRWVIVKSVVVLIAMIGVALAVHSKIYDLIMFPLQKQIDAGTVKVFYEKPISAFFVNLKIGIMGGFILALPFICYFIWRFVVPGLKKKERRYALWTIFVGLIFFILGGSFGYLFLPLGIPVLIEFGDKSVAQLWPLTEYMTFCITLIFAFGILFELPVILGLLSRLELVTSKFLADHRKHSIVLVLILAAVLTPPDPVSQIAVGLPMIVLYEMSIWIARWQEKKRKTEE